MVYISRLFITLTIALMLFGCAKEPTTLICNIDSRAQKIVIDFKENLFIGQREDIGVYANKLLISDDFYGYENKMTIQPIAINRKTLEYKTVFVYEDIGPFGEEGECSVTTFEENELNDLITKGRSHWDKVKPEEINKI